VLAGPLMQARRALPLPLVTTTRVCLCSLRDWCDRMRSPLIRGGSEVDVSLETYLVRNVAMGMQHGHLRSTAAAIRFAPQQRLFSRLKLQGDAWSRPTFELYGRLVHPVGRPWRSFQDASMPATQARA
jgi:hypothetical protein